MIRDTVPDNNKYHKNKPFCNFPFHKFCKRKLISLRVKMNVPQTQEKKYNIILSNACSCWVKLFIYFHFGLIDLTIIRSNPPKPKSLMAKTIVLCHDGFQNSQLLLLLQELFPTSRNLIFNIQRKIISVYVCIYMNMRLNI